MVMMAVMVSLDCIEVTMVRMVVVGYMQVVSWLLW